MLTQFYLSRDPEEGRRRNASYICMVWRRPDQPHLAVSLAQAGVLRRRTPLGMSGLVFILQFAHRQRLDDRARVREDQANPAAAEPYGERRLATAASFRTSSGV